MPLVFLHPLLGRIVTAVTANGSKISEALFVKIVLRTFMSLTPQPAHGAHHCRGGLSMGQSGTWISEAHLDHDNASRLSKRRSNKSLATTMTQHSVEVLSQRYALHVYQYADNLWIAEGAFLPALRTIERTVQKAVHAWQKAAIEKRLFGDDWLTGMNEGSRRA